MPVPMHTFAQPALMLTRSWGRLSRALLALAVASALLASTGPRGAGVPSATDGTDQVTTADLRPVASRTVKVERALRIAKNQIGDPYAYGGAGPNRFDCSGLVYFSARKAGFSGVPRTSSQQSRHMRRIKPAAMRPGDYLFFHNSSGVYHAAIYLGMKDGRRQILHAPGSGQRVKRNVTWTSRWFAGTLR